MIVPSPTTPPNNTITLDVGLSPSAARMTTPTPNHHSCCCYNSRPAAAVSFTDLPDALVLHVLQFLEVEALCTTVMHVSQGLRDLLAPASSSSSSYGCSAAAAVTAIAVPNNSNNNSASPAVASESVLWKPACQRKWPWLQQQQQQQQQQQGLQDNYQDATFVDGFHKQQQGLPPNYPVLLQLQSASAASNNSSGSISSSSRIDESLFCATTAADGDDTGGTRPAAAAAATELFSRLDNNDNGAAAVYQFSGTVGTGNRCLCADAPLPRPAPTLRSVKVWSHNTCARPTAATVNKKRAWWWPTRRAANVARTAAKQARRIRKAANGGVPVGPATTAATSSTDPPSSTSSSNIQPVTTTTAAALWKPFVVPYYAASPSQVVVDLTPRLISYYEVSILRLENRDTATTLPDNNARRRSSSSSWNGGSDEVDAAAAAAAAECCVAVGLAKSGSPFNGLNLMPGWDEHSFGYHGDDGGLYHGAGEMLRHLEQPQQQQQAPVVVAAVLDDDDDDNNSRLHHREEVGAAAQPPQRRGVPQLFGPGDCIGCGIDYQRRSIFYTLNGAFLGYAFCDLDADMLATTDFRPVIGVDTNCPIRCNFGTCLGNSFQFDLQSLILRDKTVMLEAMQYADTPQQQQTTTVTAGSHQTRHSLKRRQSRVRVTAFRQALKKSMAPLWRKVEIANRSLSSRTAAIASLSLGR